MSRYYLTTAIDYANGDPHLGHALEKIGADCIARYRRLQGDDVDFLMGMDEHGQKVALSAERGGMPTRTWVDTIATRFESTWHSLHCSHTDWIRTTEDRHVEAVTAFIRRIQEHNPDDLFLGEYEGVYCVGCEEFKQDAQMVDGHCLEHPTMPLTPMREQNHFFRLSRYGPQILKAIAQGAFRVEPRIRRNEILRVLEDGLQDISISRVRFPWGIPFPGEEDHTVYVWFDALINYLSATGFPTPGFATRWPADLHVVGKGITRLHCALWPAMLMSAVLPLPRMVWAHGYVQWEGAKVSKSSGVAVELDEAIARYGADPLRYYLLREVGFENDGNFTYPRFDERYVADLADGLGNLVSRSLAMVSKYREGQFPSSEENTPLDTAGLAAKEQFETAMNRLRLRHGAEAAWTIVTAANQYIVQVQPWTLAKTGQDQDLDRALAALGRALYRLALLCQPFMPAKALAIWNALGFTEAMEAGHYTKFDAPSLAGLVVQPLAPLFPKRKPEDYPIG